MESSLKNGSSGLSEQPAYTI